MIIDIFYNRELYLRVRFFLTYLNTIEQIAYNVKKIFLSKIIS